MEERIIDIVLQYTTGGVLVAFYVAWSVVRLVLKPMYKARADLLELVRALTFALRDGSFSHREVVQELKLINNYLRRD